MPTYEYLCANGHAFERFQGINDEPVRVCPECGAAAERQLSAGAGLIFKGSGFYITDYRSETYKEAAKAEGAPASEAKSDSDSKSSSGSKSDSTGKASAPESTSGKSGTGPAKSGE